MWMLALLGLLSDVGCCHHHVTIELMYVYSQPFYPHLGGCVATRLLSTSAVGRCTPGSLFLPLLWGLSQWPMPGGMGLCMGLGVGRTPQGEHSHGRLRSKPMPACHWQHAMAMIWCHGVCYRTANLTCKSVRLMSRLQVDESTPRAAWCKGSSA